jgi:hypothetical protein
MEPAHGCLYQLGMIFIFWVIQNDFALHGTDGLSWISEMFIDTLSDNNSFDLLHLLFYGVCTANRL